ncbi:hypothetical protein BHECKSOX2_483 [Bathymodiolus heckerae thiotrophic gill symbiont]|nr:hypothetical protein BHECKSOX2_483 [Bathymodiolus heckerae thiotrophic gill symbiont]
MKIILKIRGVDSTFIQNPYLLHKNQLFKTKTQTPLIHGMRNGDCIVLSEFWMSDCL